MTSATIDCDVAVVGGGAGGLSAALSARSRGATVCLVEAGQLGGDCTWTGCVPSKALLQQAHDVAAARRAGFTAPVDGGRVFETVRHRIAQVAAEEDRPTLERGGVTVVPARASFVDPHTLVAGSTRVRAATIIIATGSVPALPPIDGLRQAPVVTHVDLFSRTAVPPRAAVLGGGPVGVEAAQALARLGSRVTLLEQAPRVVPGEEAEAGAALTAALTRDGVTVRTGAPVTRVDPGPPARIHTDAGGGPVTADLVLAALGRRPDTAGLHPERAGVATDGDGHIVVDRRARTVVRHIYAVGDVVAGSRHTHTADEMGRIAVANALGRIPRRWSPRPLPRVIYTDPEVAHVGMTEAQAHAAHGRGARVAHFPLADTDRAKAAGVTDGFVKLVAGPHPVSRGLLGGRLVGATIVAPTAGDMVHEVVLAVAARTLVARIAATVHAYPSWSLAVREAASVFFGSHKGHHARPARPS